MKIYDFSSLPMKRCASNMEHNKNYGAMEQIECGIITDVKIYSIPI